jgi:hypothetical protein
MHSTTGVKKTMPAMYHSIKHTKKVKIYLASHFFSTWGMEGTKELAKVLRNIPGVEVYVPQENRSINDKCADDSELLATTIYEADETELLSSDILVACLDGVEVDSGVACEIGFMSALCRTKNPSPNGCQRMIMGLYTDIRRNGTGNNHHYLNQFVRGAVEEYGYMNYSAVQLRNNIISYVGAVEDYGKVKGDDKTEHDAMMGGLYASSLYASNVSCQLAITPSPESVTMTRQMYDQLLGKVSTLESKLAQFSVLPRISQELTSCLVVTRSICHSPLQDKEQLLSQLRVATGHAIAIEQLVVNAGMNE